MTDYAVKGYFGLLTMLLVTASLAILLRILTLTACLQDPIEPPQKHRGPATFLMVTRPLGFTLQTDAR